MNLFNETERVVAGIVIFDVVEQLLNVLLGRWHTPCADFARLYAGEPTIDSGVYSYELHLVSFFTRIRRPIKFEIWLALHFLLPC